MSDELDGMEVVAFRRLITRLTDADDEEVEQMNPIEKVDAVIDRIERVEAENERLTERVAELEAAVDPDPTGKAYREMSRDEAVRKIRETVLEQAQRSHSGKAQMTYKEVLALLDHEPSVGHAYNLMERAGREDGFQYTDNNGKVIQANSEGVKDETLFHGVNKAYSSGAD